MSGHLPWQHVGVSGDEWARTSITVVDSAGEPIENVDMLGTTLEQQLEAAETWLRNRESDLRQLEGEAPRVRLFSSWAAADGQHAMTLPHTLIAALANVGGFFWMDAYTERD